MRIRSVGVITAACAILGALIGGSLSLGTPADYRSSSILRLKLERAAEPKVIEAVRQAMTSALGQSSDATREATSVELLGTNPGLSAATLRVAFVDEDAAQAQRVTQALVDGMVKAGGFEILDPPAIAKPFRTLAAVSGLMAAGCALGLLAGWLAATKGGLAIS